VSGSTLDGVRVIDLTNYGAWGRSARKYLGDARGADVIKIEPPARRPGAL